MPSSRYATMSTSDDNPSKRSKASEDPNSTCGQSVVKPLAVLAGEVLKAELKGERYRVVDEEETRRTNEILALTERDEADRDTLDRLRVETQARIDQRLRELDEALEQSMEEIRLAQGGKINYCREHNNFTTLPANFPGCSVTDCSTHANGCRFCLASRGFDDFIGEGLPNYNENLRHWTCWVCDSVLCDGHVIQHYNTCTKGAVRRCGHKPTHSIDDQEQSTAEGCCGSVIDTCNYHFGMYCINCQASVCGGCRRRLLNWGCRYAQICCVSCSSLELPCRFCGEIHKEPRT